MNHISIKEKQLTVKGKKGERKNLILEEMNNEISEENKEWDLIKRKKKICSYKRKKTGFYPILGVLSLKYVLETAGTSRRGEKNLDQCCKSEKQTKGKINNRIKHTKANSQNTRKQNGRDSPEQSDRKRILK